MRATTEPQAEEEMLALYSSRWCWYCRRVLAVVERLGLDIRVVDVGHHPEHRHDIEEATGRRTVPVLRIERDGAAEWMFESQEIIRYLHSRFGHGK